MKKETTIQEKIEELLSYQAIAAEASAMIESLKDEIKSEMGENEELIVGEHKVRWTRVTSERFDMNKFKKAHTDIYVDFLETKSTRRFSID